MRHMFAIIVFFVLSNSMFANCKSFKTMDLTGDPSSVRLTDLDGDNCNDLIFIMVEPNGELFINIHWGDIKTAPFYKINIGKYFRLNHWATVRDSSSNVFLVKDFNNDNKKDVFTAFGILINKGDRNFQFQELPVAEKYDVLLSVVEAPLMFTGYKIIRLLPSGRLDKCSLTECTQVAQLPEPLFSDSGDLEVGDFDHDGELDIIIGVKEFGVWALFSKNGYNLSEVEIAKVHGNDFEIMDIDRDGHPDLIAQRSEFISDFPSETSLFLSTPQGFKLGKTFGNFDNHTDAATVADINGDNCLDYIQIGVDNGSAVKYGKCGDPVSVFKDGWDLVSTTLGTGVQCLNNNLNSSQCDLFIRTMYIESGERKYRLVVELPFTNLKY